MTKKEAEYRMYHFAANQVEAIDLDLDTDHPDASKADRQRLINAHAAVVLHLRACAYSLGEQIKKETGQWPL